MVGSTRPGRTPAKPAAAAAVRRPAKTPAKAARAASPTPTADALAGEMDRILTISKANPAPVPKPRVTKNAEASSSKTIEPRDEKPKVVPRAKLGAPLPATKPPKANLNAPAPVSRPVAKSRTTRSSVSPEKPSAGSSAKGARPPVAKPSSNPRTLPTNSKSSSTKLSVIASTSITKSPIDLPAWALDDAESSMSAGDRARAVMTSINGHMRELGAAVKAGYRCKSAGKERSSSSHRSDRTIEVSEEWSDKAVEKILDETELGIRTLRSMVDGGVKMSRLDVERAGQALTLKLLSFGMWERAMRFQVESRVHLLQLYEHSSPQGAGTGKGKAKVSPPPISTSASSRSASNSKATGTKTLKGLKTLPHNYLDTLFFPPASNYSALNEATLTVLFQSSASAWICVLNLGETYTRDLSDILPLPPARTPGPSDRLSPPVITCSLPRLTTTGLINNIYRSLYHHPSLADHTSLRQLLWAVLTTYVSTATGDPPPSSPEVLWGGLHRYVTTRLATDVVKTTSVQQLHAMLKETLDWIEFVIGTRKEDRQSWFSGEGWMELQDTWMNLARKVKDEHLARRLLDIRNPVPSVSIVPSTPPSKPSIASSTPSAPRASLSAPSPLRPSLPSRQSSRTRKRIQDAEAAISRAVGELASGLIVLEKQAVSAGDEALAAGAESSLLSSDLINLSDALLSLGKSSDVELVKKSIRAVERVRRSCVKIHDAAPKASKGSLGMASEKWLIGYLDLVEDQLEESSIISDGVTYDLATGAIDSVLCLLRPGTGTSAHELALLERGRRICDLSASKMTMSERADLLRCLFSSAYNIGVKYWKAEDWTNAHKFSDLSCTWAAEALWGLEKLSDSEQKDAAKTSNAIKDVMAKRYEFVACALQRLGNKDAAMSNLILSLAAQSPKVNAILGESAPTAPVAPLLSSSGQLADLGYTIARMTNMIIGDALYPEDLASKLDNAMTRAKMPGIAAGLILESLFASLEDGQYKPEVAAIMLELGDAVLRYYDGAGQEARKLRMLARMLQLFVTTDLGADRFEQTTCEVKAIASSLLKQDVALANFAREYRATALVLVALQNYHIQPDPSGSVVECTNAAMEDLRNMIIPTTAPCASPKKEGPTSRPPKKSSGAKAAVPPKTPARRKSDPKRPKLETTPSSSRRHVSEQAKPRSSLVPSDYDDLPRLIRLLDGLTSLLGVLGHTFARIDCLKTLRGLLRSQSDMADEYIVRSAELAGEYAALGKDTRAGIVFAQAIQLAKDNGKVADTSKTVLHLRYSAYLAGKLQVDEAIAEYGAAEALEKDWIPISSGRVVAKTVDRCDQVHRSILARRAMVGIKAAQGGARSCEHQEASYQLWWKISDNLCRLASSASTSGPEKLDDPFAMPDAPKLTGQDEPAKDAMKPANGPADVFKEKRLFCLQWFAAEGLFNATMELVHAYTTRGSVKDAEYYLNQASILAGTVKSSNLAARVKAHWAHFDARLKKFESSSTKLEEASVALADESPEMVELKRIQGDIFTRNDQIEDAADVFESTEQVIVELEEDFVKLDARLPTPRKVAAATSNDIILPSALRHVLRQQAWVARQGGSKDIVEALLARLRSLGGATDNQAEESYLRGRLQLFSAFEQFKTDLFMSSLTESTIAMPMNISLVSSRDRASSRLGIAALLERADDSFRRAMEQWGGGGAVEDVRQARLNVALLHAFQTSLQNGSSALTGATANLLASNSSITLQRELLQIVNEKFKPAKGDAVAWPLLAPSAKAIDADTGVTDSERERHELLRTFWKGVQSRHTSSLLAGEPEYDLSILPSHWAVISINVTDDHNTMFISRHQRDHEPLVICLPLDRQGRREGDDEEDLFTFDVALAEMNDIIATSDATSRNGKNLVTAEEKQGWWDTRRSLNQRLEELLLNIEYVWLGPFKGSPTHALRAPTILSPRGSLAPGAISAFREKIQKVFVAALGDAGGDTKKASAVAIPEPLMECFATLSNKCKDEEVEDLIYFILDIYQFHGVPVAIAELDIDQIGVDVRGALLESELKASLAPTDEEHLFLVLDRNVAGFPWESIPSLRGRPSSRIPSLPFLLDQVSMSRQLRSLSPAPSPASSSSRQPKNGMKRTDNLSSALSRLSLNPAGGSTSEDFRHTVNARKVFYVLNPSGDLSNTQTHFEGWINQMVDSAGWKGIVGRAPTELELSRAYQDYDLVLYFGHGGAEQYIRSHKVKTMASCATTMLWGCSSGALADQGDLDRHGTPWNYMMAGCPSLVANLWDVTDRDIDRLSEAVLQKLHLDISHISRKGQSALPISDLSVVQAVNRSRGDCKFHYLTGAAPVVYGLPAYFH